MEEIYGGEFKSWELLEGFLKGEFGIVWDSLGRDFY
jgi:hypothetical protein